MAANRVLIPVLLLLVVPLFVGADRYKLCDIDPNSLRACQPAVTPPESPPTPACCAVIHDANLKCLCNLKSAFPAMGINTADALALPAKCGLPVPPECHL